jgi:hypothetical protein
MSHHAKRPTEAKIIQSMVLALGKLMVVTLGKRSQDSNVHRW